MNIWNIKMRLKSSLYNAIQLKNFFKKLKKKHYQRQLKKQLKNKTRR